MKTTTIVISMIVMMFMPGFSVQAEDFIYDFDDGTLQGWSNFEGVTEEFVAWNQADGRANIEPARSGVFLVKEADFGDRDGDTSVKILTSPVFWMGAATSVEIWTLGGTGSVATPTWRNYANLPAVASGADFMGAALRRISDGEYLLFSRRSSVGEGLASYAAIGWDAGTIAAAVAGDGASEQYVVDIIDTFSGVWGWITVDDITLTDVELVGNVIARRPNPDKMATDVSRDVVPNWTPGLLSDQHDVYFGTNLDTVTNASRTNPLDVLVSEGQDATSYDFGRLEFGQTYFWRIDEVNDPAKSTVFTGEVWSFTVEPFSRPIANITVTASGSFGASVPENTINGSGLADDLHGTLAADMWISAGLPATIEYAFDRAYKLHEAWIWNSNQVIEGFVGFGAKDVVIEHSLDGENWTVLDGVGPLAQAPGAAGYAHTIPSISVVP